MSLSLLPIPATGHRTHNVKGGVAQMVERSLSMREVPGSIPGASPEIFSSCDELYYTAFWAFIPFLLFHFTTKPNLT